MLSTGPVENVEPDSARLTGSLSPGGFDAHYRFQWGTTRKYGREVPWRLVTDAGSGSEAVAHGRS